jgi:hypothetical protein
LLAPRPTPILEDHASVFISPRDRVATHFSLIAWYFLWSHQLLMQVLI